MSDERYADGTWKTKPGRCPECQASLDACDGCGDGRGPEAGDMSICLYCGSVLVFAQDLSIRFATTSELEELDAATRAEVLRLRSIRARVLAEEKGRTS